MANSRPTRDAHRGTKAPSPRKHQERKVKRLFQGDILTAIFGRSVGTLIMRSILFVVALSLFTIITVGLLHPGSASTITSSTSSSSSPVGIQIGDTAPNFTLTTLNGKQVSLSDFRGKPVMLNFWYATCPGCLLEIPGMQQFYAAQQAAGKHFVILGVNSVDDTQTAQQFSLHYRLTYTLVMDQNQQVATLYNLTATPTSYFIDTHGIIRSIVVGPVDDATLQQKVAEISQA